MDRIILGLLAFVIWNISLDLANASIFNSPVDTEVMVGQSTYFNCSTSDPSREIHWYHYPVGAETKDHEYVYAHGRMYAPFDKRFRIEKDNSSGSFDLVLTDVEYRDAGLYVCQNAGDTKQLISAQLVVLDSLPSCETNMESVGFIGPNSCNLKLDRVQLSCRVNYHGNIPPALEWTGVGQKPLCDISDTRITCNVSMDADVNMDGSSFVCQTKRAVHGQYMCITDKAKVLYAVGNKESVEKKIGDEVTCSAKTNSPSCTYKWIRFDGVTEDIISNDQNLKVADQGWHKCEASCKIKENPCDIIPVMVKGSAAPIPATVNDSPIGIIIAVVVTFLLCLTIAAIPGYFLWRKMNDETRELRSSVEELREKDNQWKEEKSEVQAQLRQVEELTATILEAHAREQNQTDEKGMKTRLEQLNTMLVKLVRAIPVYQEESRRSNYEFNVCLGSMSNGKKKKEKETSALSMHEETMMPFICESITDKELRKDMPSVENNRKENLSSFINKNNETGEDRTSDDLCENRSATFNSLDFLVSKQKKFG